MRQNLASKYENKNSNKRTTSTKNICLSSYEEIGHYSEKSDRKYFRDINATNENDSGFERNLETGLVDTIFANLKFLRLEFSSGCLTVFLTGQAGIFCT